MCKLVLLSGLGSLWPLRRFEWDQSTCFQDLCDRVLWLRDQLIKKACSQVEEQAAPADQIFPEPLPAIAIPEDGEKKKKKKKATEPEPVPEPLTVVEEVAPDQTEKKKKKKKAE